MSIYLGHNLLFYRFSINTFKSKIYHNTDASIIEKQQAWNQVCCYILLLSISVFPKTF